MVAVDVAVTTRPDKVAHFETALLRDHVREQRIAGNVERHAQKNVSTSLVQLAAELAFAARLGRRCHIKLEQRVAGHQRHFVQVGHVPRTDDDAT